MGEPDFVGLFVRPLEDLDIPYMITGAVATGSDRPLRDVNGMLRVSADLVDRDAFQAWIERLDLVEELERARSYEG